MLEKVGQGFCSDWFHRSNENPVKSVNSIPHSSPQGTTILIKRLSNQLFANHLFPTNTTMESIKQMNFKSCLKFLLTFNVPEVYSEPCQTPETDRFVKIYNS